MTRRRAAKTFDGGRFKRPTAKFKRLSVRTRRRRVKPGPRRLPGAAEPTGVARRRITRRGKNLRAFGAYLDLLDTAGHFKSYLRGQLETFDLTLRGFRMLEMIYREGVIAVGLAAQRMDCSRQNADGILLRLEERGWVAREIWTRPAAEIDESRLPVRRRGQPREGGTMAAARLTERGEEFIGTIFPMHAKVVKCMMRALDGREQVTLSRLLRKLREGDPVKFVREIRIYDEEDWRTVVKSR